MIVITGAHVLDEVLIGAALVIVAVINVAGLVLCVRVLRAEHGKLRRQQTIGRAFDGLPQARRLLLVAQHVRLWRSRLNGFALLIAGELVFAGLAVRMGEHEPRYRPQLVAAAGVLIIAGALLLRDSVRDKQTNDALQKLRDLEKETDHDHREVM